MPADTRPPAIAIMGPTASGKTALAIAWAERLGGEIVSVDSALVYRGLDIGSAKPDAKERARAPHHLLDLRDPHERYSAAEFATDAMAALEGIAARGRIPLLVGGTGLYFRALLQGLSPMPSASSELRDAIAEEGAARGWDALHAELAQVDPAAGQRIKVGDRQRIGRALEVWRISGRSITDWQTASARRMFPFRVLKLILAPADRAVLHARIEARFDSMLMDGFLDEVRRLRAEPQLRSLADPLDLPALRAVGYRQAWEYLDAIESSSPGAHSVESPSPNGRGVGVRGEQEDAMTATRQPLIRPSSGTSVGDAVFHGAQTAAFADFRNRAIFATRQLAKRQLTWLRGEIDARWFDPGGADAQGDRLALEQALALFLGHPERG